MAGAGEPQRFRGATRPPLGKFMETIVIDKYRIVPAPLTGIGWVAVEAWYVITGEYKGVGI